MMRSVIPEIPPREPKIIRLTVEQEAVLLEQFNRWPKIPMHADIVLLAAETGLSEEDVHVSEIHFHNIHVPKFVSLKNELKFRDNFP